MGILDKLWDETLAGPKPDTGLGKLRKHPTATKPLPLIGTVDPIIISRTISIVKNTDSGSSRGSLPDTPITPSTPYTPGTPLDGDFTRRKSPIEALENIDSRSSSVHDWIILNALDR